MVGRLTLTRFSKRERQTERERERQRRDRETERQREGNGKPEREREGVWRQKRHSVLLTVRSRLGLKHQSGWCECRIREVRNIAEFVAVGKFGSPLSNTGIGQFRRGC